MEHADQFFMDMAKVAVTRANCLRRQVGAVLMRNHHVLSTGYNGTSAGVRNCTEGGCDRCYNTKDYPAGQAYDLCICVHAEANAILQAARRGTAVEGAVLYTTLRPCLGCLKEAINAGIVSVVFETDWIVPIEQLENYQRLEKIISVKKYVPPVEEEVGIRHRISTQN